MKIDLSSVFYLIAASQALLMIVIIARKIKVTFSERILIGVLTALAITLLHYTAMINQIFVKIRWLSGISAISWLAISPLLYMYSKAIMGQISKWRWRFLIYFPFSIYMFIQWFLTMFDVHVGFFMFFTDWNAYTVVWIMMYLINSFIFSIFSIRVLTKGDYNEKFSNNFKWMVNFFRGFTIVLGILIFMLLYWLNTKYFYENFEFLLLLCYSLFIFSIVTISLRFSSYFSILANNQYGHDKKGVEQLDELRQSLVEYLELERPYLNPKLSLTDLSKSLAITENDLSQLFSKSMNSSFYQVINECRLREFDHLLVSKGTEQFTILALAELAGFGAKATFYKVFKEYHGMTPTQYIKARK